MRIALATDIAFVDAIGCKSPQAAIELIALAPWPRIMD
jgi:hypothetical protein